jgi:hypothetical protein
MLVPVRIEDVRPPWEFRRLQAADFFNWQSGFGGPDFDACLSVIEQLVRSTVAIDMRKFASRPTAPVTPPQQQPPHQTGTAYPPPTQPVPPVPPPVYGRPPMPPPRYATGAPPPVRISTYLFPAILVTFCCAGMPFGIVAVVYALQVSSKLNAGDIEGAVKASREAKRWCIVALCVGLAVMFLWMMNTMSR